MNVIEGIEWSKRNSRNISADGKKRYDGNYGPWIENKITKKRIRYTNGKQHLDHCWQLTVDELTSNDWEELVFDGNHQTGICDPVKFAETRKRSVRKRKECIRTFKSKDWKDSLKHFKNKCAYCREDLFDYNTHQEHVVAISNGGNHVRNNVVPSCDVCNNKKYRKDYKIFMKEQGFEITEELKTWLEQDIVQ